MNASAPEPLLRRRVRAETLLTLALCVGLMAFTVCGALTAPLSISEEHRILEDALGGPPQWWRVASDDVTEFGRLRPVFLGWHFFKIALVGARPVPQHLLTLALGVLAAFALSRALRAAGADLASALLFPALVLLSGPQGDVWYLLFSSAETVAMPLLALALWGLAHAARRPASGRLDALWLGAAWLAALAKESFALVLPALLLLRVALESCAHEQSLWRTARARRGVLIWGLALCALVLAGAASLVWLLPQSYGARAAGFGAHSLQPATWWATSRGADVWPLMRHALAALPLLGLLVALAPSKRRALAHVALALTACVGWSVPQAVLYAGTMAQRYTLPALVAPAALYAGALAWLWRTGRAWARVLVLLGWGWAACTSAAGVAGIFGRAWWWGAEARSTAAAVATLAHEVPRDRTIVALADPATPWGFEATFALPGYLQQAGFRGRVLLAPVEARPAERTALHTPLAARVIAERSVHLQGDPARVGGAVLVNDDRRPGSLLWLMELGRWRDCGWPQPLYRLDWRPPFVVRAGSFVRRALVRWSPSPVFPPERPLVQVSPALAELVGVNPSLGAPYGLEVLQDRTVAWLPPADAGALEGVLWAERALDVRVHLEVSYGPSRSDTRRTVQFSLGPGPGAVQQATFERGAVVGFDAHLGRGANRFRVAATDPADVPQRPGGDPRRLIVLVHAVTIAPR